MTMTRITITSYDEDGAPHVEGWFDPNRGETFTQGTEWDGDNRVGVITGSEAVDEYLYRTPGGRWVINRDAHRYNYGSDTYAFVTDDQARDWLLRSEVNDEALAKYFGEPDEESGPVMGRPTTIGGRPINLRLPHQLLDDIDAAAETVGVSRSEWIRQACAERLVSAH